MSLMQDQIEALRQAMSEKSGDHNMNQKDNIVFRYDNPTQLFISPSAYEQHSVIYGQGNTAWAKIDKNLKLVHIDMDVCAKSPANAFTALAIGVWNAAIEAAAKTQDDVRTEDGECVGDQIRELKK